MGKAAGRVELWLTLGWLVMAALMSWSYFGDPRVDPHAPGGTPHYMNIHGELWPWLIVSLAELGLVFLLLRRWDRAWKRALVVVGGGLLVLWMLATAVFTVGSHAGSVMTVHMMWLLLLTPVAFVVMVRRASNGP